MKLCVIFLPFQKGIFVAWEKEKKSVEKTIIKHDVKSIENCYNKYKIFNTGCRFDNYNLKLKDPKKKKNVEAFLFLSRFIVKYDTTKNKKFVDSTLHFLISI